MKIKHFVWIILTGAILTVALVPKLINTKQSSNPAQNDKKGAKPNRVISVSVQVAELLPIQDKIMVSGTISASQDIEIRNETGGRVTSVNFKEGMVVTKGQLLVKLNDSDLQAQLLKAQAAFKLSKDKELRQKGLLEKQVISTEEYQNSLKDLETSEADILLLTSQIEKAKIIAPFTGAIGLSTISEGTFLSMGTKIANLVSIGELDIECNIAERHVASLSKGTKLTFTLSGSSKVYKAAISAIEPKIDYATRTVAVKARINNPDDHCLAGSFAKIIIIINERKGILVPSNAIISDIEGYKVYIVKGDQSLPRIVKTGYRDEKNVEIVSGINPGDTMITTGAFMLRPKSKIEIRTIVKDR